MEVPIVWVGVEDLPVYAVNKFVLQDSEGNGEYFLYAGVLTPPVVLGPEEARRQQLESLTHVEVQPVARLALNEKRLRELRDLLDRAVNRMSARRSEG